MTSITLNNISKKYGDHLAIDNLSAEINQGELVTILGPSGSGKTTLLSVISGLSQPSSGTIFLGNRDVTGLSPAKRNIGLMFQSYALFPHMSVYENIAFPLSIRRIGQSEIRRRVTEILAILQLPGFELRRPSQLSGGQQQRVALARALVFSPDILLLDEPLGALDKKLREEVQIELRRVHRTLGMTTILVTHDQEEALALSDRVLVLEDGRVRQFASPREIYSKPSSTFVAGFLGTANFLEGVVQCVEGQTQLKTVHGAVVPIAVSTGCGGERMRAVVRPENIALLTPNDAKAVLEGHILDAIFLGQSTRYHVQTCQPEPFVVVAKESYVQYQQDSRVGLTWRAEDVWVLPIE